MKCHFKGGPWDGKTVELPVPFDPMDVEQGQGNHVRYRLARWENGMPHYEVDGMPRVSGQERRFPMPAGMADVRGTAERAAEPMLRSDADAAIAKVAAWLHYHAVNGEKDGAAADVAREFCTQLLEAARADDHGGCPLCQS